MAYRFVHVYVCMYVCMVWYGMVWYGCMYVCMYIYIYTYSVCVCVYIHIYIYRWYGQPLQNNLVSGWWILVVQPDTIVSKTWDADLRSAVTGWDRSQVACKHEWNKWNGCLSNLVEVDWDFPFKKNILPPKERIALGTTIEGVLCSDWMIRWTKILSPCDVWVIIGSSWVGRIEPSQREPNPRYLGWSGGLL